MIINNKFHMTYYVYIITNKKHGVLYIGVTSNIQRRMYEHKHGLVNGFSKRYHLTMLVYVEETSDVRAALQREKNLKHWLRQWKIDLIESLNPEWYDLSNHLNP